jgi:hypothetical protein
MARSQIDVESLGNKPGAGRNVLGDSVPGGSGSAQVPSSGGVLSALGANLSAAASAGGAAAAAVPAVAIETAASPQGRLFVGTAKALIAGAPEKAATGFATTIVAGLTGAFDVPSTPPVLSDKQVIVGQAKDRPPPPIKTINLAAELAPSAPPPTARRPPTTFQRMAHIAAGPLGLYFLGRW